MKMNFQKRVLTLCIASTFIAVSCIASVSHAFEGQRFNNQGMYRPGAITSNGVHYNYYSRGNYYRYYSNGVYYNQCNVTPGYWTYGHWTPTTTYCW